MFILQGREGRTRRWARGLRFGGAGGNVQASTLATEGMTATEVWVDRITDYKGASSKTALSGRVYLSIAASDAGIIAEAGGNGVGFVFYAHDGQLYLQHGDGDTFGDATNRIEISAPIPAGAEVLEFSCGGTGFFGSNIGKAALYADGVLIASKISTAHSESQAGGSNSGGLGDVHAGNVARNRGGWNSAGPGAYTGTITQGLIYADQVTAELV